MPSPTAENLVEALLDYLDEHDLADALPRIIERLESEARIRRTVSVTSARPLAAAERAELERRLTAEWGDYPLHFSEDPELLSGLVIRFGDRIVDTSGKTKLAELARTLTS